MLRHRLRLSVSFMLCGILLIAACSSKKHGVESVPVPPPPEALVGVWSVQDTGWQCQPFYPHIPLGRWTDTICAADTCLALDIDKLIRRRIKWSFVVPYPITYRVIYAQSTDTTFEFTLSGSVIPPEGEGCQSRFTYYDFWSLHDSVWNTSASYITWTTKSICPVLEFDSTSVCWRIVSQYRRIE